MKGLIPKKKVSVPLRGLWFLSDTDDLMNVVTDVNVSVPLRGLWFLSETLSTLTHALERVCFRPLTGIVVLI